MYKIITLSVLLFFSSISLFANQFPYIQPVSVEVAPQTQKQLHHNKVTTLEKTAEIKKEKKKTKNNSKKEKHQIKIYFQYNKTILNESATKQLQTLAQYLTRNKDIQVVIYGYYDEGENQKLAQQRADKVAKLLNYHGVKSIRLTAIGTNIEKLDSVPKREDKSQIEILLIQ